MKKIHVMHISGRGHVRLLDKYTVLSVIKIGLVTLSLCTLMMLLVELFANFQTYTESYMNFKRASYLLILRIPYAISLTIGPAFLFATTFFISSIYSNNEMIALLSAGIPYYRVVTPICLFSIVASLFMFFFNEYVYIPSNVRYNTTLDIYKNSDNTYEGDNSNIFYVDRENNYIVKIDRYVDRRQELAGVDIIFKNEDGSVSECVTARLAKWIVSQKTWELQNVKKYDIDEDDFYILTSEEDTLIDLRFSREPDFFKDIRSDIQTMSIPNAIDYLRTIRNLSVTRYNELATDFYERVLSCFTIFVMMLVSISINLRFKKNVLLFSIIASLSLGVIYYVTQLVTLLLAKQGMIAPLLGMVIPFIVITVVAFISASSIRS